MEKTLVIDPGHGGKSPGTISLDGVKEKVYCLELSLKVYAIVSKHVKTIITRKTDIYHSLGQKGRIAKKHKPCYLFSFHFNAFKPTANGIEIFVSKYGTKNRAFATYLCKEFSKKFAIKNRGSKIRLKDNGEDYYYLQRETGDGVTCFIVETCFLSNRQDLDFLLQKGKIDEIAFFYSKEILSNLYNINIAEKTFDKIDYEKLYNQSKKEIKMLIEKLNFEKDKLRKIEEIING